MSDHVYCYSVSVENSWNITEQFSL